MLMLSGIQHYVFCPRQWALIHIEMKWEDNRLTTEGNLLHENVDNPFYRQKNGSLITLRSVRISSSELGLSGIIDAMELLPTDSPDKAITHGRYPGYWKPFVVEYKRGREKPDRRDEVQLAAQIMCLEEMYGISIQEGAFFYGEPRQRHRVVISEELREFTRKCAEEMHTLFALGKTPVAVRKPHCRSCSLANECMPRLTSCRRASDYNHSMLYEDTT